MCGSCLQRGPGAGAGARRVLPQSCAPARGSFVQDHALSDEQNAACWDTRTNLHPNGIAFAVEHHTWVTPPLTTPPNDLIGCRGVV
ncbi:hypothetical protein SKAU_G00297970 [Synaphobranchus kaupii]|uniref:Uncharacterized protein n=1 Tax=Synaphobranchus kaupii TaxID=118154 RepID=A0A9Q1EV51_SYNKA|nr:hypothetical protein SKAU_G00297970 [Synaphobranchus kaupii]